MSYVGETPVSRRWQCRHVLSLMQPAVWFVKVTQTAARDLHPPTPLGLNRRRWLLRADRPGGHGSPQQTWRALESRPGASAASQFQQGS